MTRSTLVVAVLLGACGGGRGGDDGDDTPALDAEVPAIDAREGPDGDGMAPTFVGVTPADGSLIDWGQEIVLEWSEAIVSEEVTGTLGAQPAPMHNGSSVTLQPSPTWNADSGRTLTIVATDTDGYQSAMVTITYDVLDGGVYVHQTAGAAGNPGTRSEPQATIASGIAAADAFYETGEVRVAAATYQESFTVPTGVTVLGGYDPTDWDTVPNRTSFPTIIDDQRTGTVTAHTVTLSPDSGIERLVVRSATGVTGTCAAVSLAAATAGSQRVIDSELEARACTTANAVRATSTLAGLTIHRSDLHGSGAAGTSKMVSLVLDAGASAGVVISNSEIRAHTSASAESAGVEVTVNTTPPTVGVTLVNNHIRGGGGSDGSTGRSYGVNLTIPGSTYVIDRCRIHGGTAAVETIGVRAGASETSTTITRSAIHGGEPQLDDKDATGVSIVGRQAWLWNNLVTGGGRVDASITAGDSIGILATTTYDTQIRNNTVHVGFLSRGGAIVLATSGNVNIGNNVLFAAGTLAGGFTTAVQEASATADPTYLGYNRAMGFGAGGAVLYQDHVGTGGTGCAGFPQWNCYSAAADLDDESRTTQLGAGTADANTVGDAGFQDVDGADGQVQTLFDTDGVLENQWWPTPASAIKTAGRDGSGKGAAFTNDYVNAPRTGDFITGWSIGAYEQDN